VPSAEHDPRPRRPTRAGQVRGARLFAGTTEGFVLADSLELRGLAPKGSQVLSPAQALWILDESWKGDGGLAIRRFADERGIGTTSIQQVADLQLRRILATHVERGELVVVRETFKPRPFPAPPVAKAGPAPVPLAAPAPAPAVEAAPIVVDETAQLQALWAAARDGVPFCEECAKALQRAA